MVWASGENGKSAFCEEDNQIRYERCYTKGKTMNGLEGNQKKAIGTQQGAHQCTDLDQFCVTRAGNTPKTQSVYKFVYL